MLRYIHETCDHAWDLALDAAAMGHVSGSSLLIAVGLAV